MNDNERRREEFVQKLRDYQAQIVGWFKQFRETKDDDKYEESEEYKAALAYYRQFKHQDGVEYGTALEYARNLFSRYDEADKGLDEKADSIIKYLGGGSALITIGTLLSIKPDSSFNLVFALVALVCLIPSIYCATKALHYAIHARKPRASATLPPVKFAVEMAEYHKTKDQIELNLWLIFHPICEAYHYRNFAKAQLVNKAHVWYKFTMQFLLVPVIGVFLTVIGMLMAGKHTTTEPAKPIEVKLELSNKAEPPR